MAPNAPDRIGPYQVVELLGKGGMASVYKAVQPSLNRLVAIKVLPREFAQDAERVERFHREAQAVALLNHPNIVHIIDKDQDGETLYFVMEYVEGTSLGVVLFQRKLSLGEALHIAKEVGKALEYAHLHKIVHRDLKPGNVLVSPDLSTVKLADFGISRIDPQGTDTRTLTTTQTSLGTLHYCAPEQIESPKAVDHRADIYSLGVICYEMLTGRVPLGKFRLPSQMNDQLPAELDQIVLRCLASDPSDRYQNATELLTDIETLEKTTGFRLVAELKLLSQSTSRLIRKSTTRVAKGRQGWMYGAAAGLVALMAVIGIVVARRSPPQPPPVSASDASQVPSVDAQQPAPASAAAPVPAPSTSTAPPGPAVSVAPAAPAVAPPQPPPPAGTTAPRSAADSGAPTATRSRSEPRVSPPVAPAREPRSPTAPTRPVADRTAALANNLAIARTKADARLYDQALADIKTILDDPDASTIAPDAYLLMASIHERQGRLDDARGILVEMAERHKDDPRVGDALLKLAQLTLRGRDGERNARTILTQMLARVSTGPAVLPALLEKARLEDRLNLVERDPVLMAPVPSALVTYRTIAERFPDRPEAEQALWTMGEMLDDLNRYPAAAAAFVDLGARFPETRRDAWFRAGEIFERRIKDKERARDAYQRVPPTSSRYREAQRRAERLK